MILEIPIEIVFIFILCEEFIVFFSYFVFIDGEKSCVQAHQMNDENPLNNVPPLSKQYVQNQLDTKVYGLRDVIKRNVKNHSDVWARIKQVVDENKNDVKGFFCCENCMTAIHNGSKSGTTTQFIRHICKIEKGQTSITQFTTSSVEKQQRKKTKISEEHKKHLRDGCVQYICSDLRPYYAIEGEGFFAVSYACFQIGQANPNMTKEEFADNFPSKATVQRDIEVKVVTAKNVIKTKLQDTYEKYGGFACTSDLWTDQFRQRTYLSVTANLCTLSAVGIQYHRYVLCIEELDEPVKSKEVTENHILAALESYGFSRDMVKSSVNFVTDRGSQFKTMAIFKRANCWAHLINNVVEEMCKDSEAKQIISDAASLVRYLKKAGLNHRLNISLKSYVDTRWSTVYMMLRSIIPHYETIYNMLEQREKLDRSHRGCLKHIECLQKSSLDRLAELLKPFKAWIDFMEADMSINIHKVWPIYTKMMAHLKISSEDPEDMSNDKNFVMIEAMKSRGRDYVRKRADDFEPTTEQQMAVALHPRLKRYSYVYQCVFPNNSIFILIHSTFFFDLAIKRLKAANDTKRELIYSAMNTLISDDVSKPTPDSPQKRKSSSDISLLYDDFDDSDSEDAANSGESRYCKELTQYLRLSSPEDAGFRTENDSVALAQWWYNHREVFPKLFRLFMRVSSIPASSAQSERCFSITGQIISSRRSCILPKNVSNIMMCRNLYR